MGRAASADYPQRVAAMNALAEADPPSIADDVCALPLVRRLAAMLDRDPGALRQGDALPRGWHAAFFNLPTRQSQLRSDGVASFGVMLPEPGLPRLMLAGRQCRFAGSLPIGAALRRESRQSEVQIKQGRSGRFALLKVEHRIFVDGAADAAVIEQLDYVLREAVSVPAAQTGNATAAPALPAAPPATASEATAMASASPSPPADASRTLTPDERLLFRYSAITDNPHRIHYDQPYATGSEGYPALVVNGSIPAMFLLDMFRACAGREPDTFQSRNVAPMFCGHTLHLQVRREEASWHLWAVNDQGHIAFDARAT